MDNKQKYLSFGEIFTCLKCRVQKANLNGKEYSMESFKELSDSLNEECREKNTKLLTMSVSDKLCFKCKEYKGDPIKKDV